MTLDQENKMEFCIENAELLNDWESDFIDSIRLWSNGGLSELQSDKLEEIVNSLILQGAEPDV